MSMMRHNAHPVPNTRLKTALSMALLMGAVLFFLAGCAVNPVTGRSELAFMQVSPAEEVALGERTFPRAIQQMGGRYSEAELQAYVNQVGMSMARLSDRPDLPYQFVVVDDSTPNAFALPGGFIAITRGLLSQMQNEAQLAAVLGHEIGHVTARHSLQGLQRGALFNVALSVLSGVTEGKSYGPLVGQAGQVTAALLETRYSREQERESDRLGIDYMVHAGYNPMGAVQLQELFYRQIEGGAEPKWLEGLFRTHPFSVERMQDNEQYVLTTYPGKRGGVYGVEAFQQRVAELKRRQPAYDLYEQARALEKKGQAGEAVATYLRAAELAPEAPLILTGLGMAYLRAEDPGSARLHLAKAVELGGEYYLPRMGLGYIYLEQKQPRLALTQLEKSMDLLPTLQGGFLLAEAYEETGQVKRAEQLFEEVAQADPRGKLGQAAAQRLMHLKRGR